MEYNSLIPNEVILLLHLRWIIQAKKGDICINSAKVCIMHIKDLWISELQTWKRSFFLFFGVGCNFPTPSYTPSYTTYLFDNQIKIIAGVGCRKYWYKLDNMSFPFSDYLFMKEQWRNSRESYFLSITKIY